MSWKNLNYVKKGVIIGLLLWFIILVSILFLPKPLVDREWRSCASSLQESQPNIDPGDVDVSLCGVKSEGARDFLLSLEHNWLKRGEIRGLSGIIFYNLSYLAFFLLIGALVGFILGKIKSK